MEPAGAVDPREVDEVLEVDEVKEGPCTFEVYKEVPCNRQMTRTSMSLRSRMTCSPLTTVIMIFIVLHQAISATGTDRFVSAWMLYR